MVHRPPYGLPAFLETFVSGSTVDGPLLGDAYLCGWASSKFARPNAPVIDRRFRSDAPNLDDLANFASDLGLLPRRFTCSFISSLPMQVSRPARGLQGQFGDADRTLVTAYLLGMIEEAGESDGEYRSLASMCSTAKGRSATMERRVIREALGLEPFQDLLRFDEPGCGWPGPSLIAAVADTLRERAGFDSTLGQRFERGRHLF